MTNEYIRKQDASDWLKQYGQDVLHGRYKFSLMYIWKNLMDLPPVDVVPVETLQAKISELKYQMDCRTPNIDYYTGYMSALSTVEGILAAMRGE